jgi:hypothetical protein
MNALVLAVALLASHAPQRGEGRVLQSTASRAYLDAGADDGLVAGTELVLHRGGIEVGRCRPDAVALHAASCAASGLRTGDTFALPARPVREEARRLPPPATPEQLSAQQAALAAAPIAAVEFTAPARTSAYRAPPSAEVQLSELAWISAGTRAFTATRAGLSIRSADVGLGLRLDLDAQAIRWTSRPTDPAVRFRPNDASQLYVWQASLSRDLDASGLAFSVGRILPWRIPGATVLDGATAGWRGERVELGAFAGFVPRPSTLGLAGDRAVAGGYWGWEWRVAQGITLRDDGRIAVVRSPELGTRLEAETRAAARLGRPLDLSGSVRLGLGGDVNAPGNVDGARLEVSFRPVNHVRLAGWLAYDGLEVPADAEPSIYPGHSRRMEGNLAWESPVLRVSAIGGAAQDLGTGLDRAWGGPMFELPRLFAGHGGLSLAYLEELGWSDGRSAWIQAVYRPWRGLRLLARAAWAHASSYAVTQDDLAATLGLAVDVTRAVTARITATGRAPIQSSAGDTVGGGTLFATVAARY